MKPYPFPGSNLLARSLRCPTPIHVVLMGPPGSGKTSVGRLVAERLKLPFLDVDNDWLEMRWGTSVADKLKQVGDERFLDEEDEQLSHLASAPFLYMVSPHRSVSVLVHQHSLAARGVAHGLQSIALRRAQELVPHLSHCVLGLCSGHHPATPRGTMLSHRASIHSHHRVVTSA